MQAFFLRWIYLCDQGLHGDLDTRHLKPVREPLDAFFSNANIRTLFIDLYSSARVHR
jgi:hypothetical protein